MDRIPRGEAGIGMVEVAIAGVLAVILLVAGTVILDRGQTATTQTLRILDVDSMMRTTLDDISRAVRLASRDGEDTNGNDSLDPSEDENGNGRFENDWAITASSITYNVRLASGYSLPITYRLNGDVVEKVVMMTPAGRTQTLVAARGVESFVVTDASPGVKIAMTVSAETPSGRTASRSDSITVIPRN